MLNLSPFRGLKDSLIAELTPPEAQSRTLTPADSAAQERVEESLGRLKELGEALAADETGEVAPLSYSLPAGFKLSVVIPVYNEDQTIRQVVASVAALPLPKEIIIVDDSSTDGTRRVLEELATRPEIRIVLRPRNEGKGAALRTGFAQATGNVIVVQDADLEYDPRDIPSLVAPLVAGEADVVFGSRFLGDAPRDPSLWHRLGNGLLTWLSNRLTGLSITDMETCYKAFRREALAGMVLRQNRFGFEPEITAKLARRKCRIRELPIGYRPRSYAEGKKIGLKDAFNALYCIVRYAVAD
jgi:glycosyltransferase involved in cell wall biosynthesis